MTDPSRTERRLLQSIRSAKTGSPARIEPDAGTRAGPAGESRQAAKEGPVPRRDAIGAREAVGILMPGQGEGEAAPLDGYQRFRRVWPD
jgi:hypothetical protein